MGMQKKKFQKEFGIKDLGEYNDLYVQGNTVLLADVFESFQTKGTGIYNLDPDYFLSAPGLSLQATLKKTKVELELLPDIDTLLMIEKDIRSLIFFDMEKLITNT